METPTVLQTLTSKKPQLGATVLFSFMPPMGHYPGRDGNGSVNYNSDKTN
jgi:hypothetical protein